MARTHLIIPDVQIKPNEDYSFLSVIGNYIVDKKPDVVVCLGDFADMPSLSSYDVGKKSFEGRRYKDDVASVHEAMDMLLEPLYTYNHFATKNKKKQYHPEMVLTLGNHEDRITRAINNDSKLDGTIGIEDLAYDQYGWMVYPYLEVVLIDGIAYSHYFTSGVMGRPVTSARALVTKKHISCVQGHHQKMEIYNEYRADGKCITGLFAGCCYLHDEEYMGPQGNNHFRGIHMLYEVDDGSFQCHSITLNYLIGRHERRLHNGKV
jgi:hypothetical protein